MQFEGNPSDEMTFRGLLKACGNLKVKTEGFRINGEITRRGLETQLLIGNSLVDMYAKVGSLMEARKVFNKLSIQTVVSWTALIAGYVDRKQGNEALGCLRLMQLTQGYHSECHLFYVQAKGLQGCTDPDMIYTVK